MRRALTEDEQHKVAAAIVEHLESDKLEDRAWVGSNQERHFA
jgi:hypothetical protein